MVELGVLAERREVWAVVVEVAPSSACCWESVVAVLELYSCHPVVAAAALEV